MKQICLGFCLGLLLLANSADAAPKQVNFLVGPRAGVTVDQLSQAEINALAQRIVAVYQEEIALVERQYQQAVDDLYLDPNIDESGELLNTRMSEINAARETGFVAAIGKAVRATLRDCRGLCYVVANGQRFE